VGMEVRDELAIMLNYQEAPPLKFLVLEARNENQMANHFIRIHFLPSQNMISGSLLGLAVTVLGLVLLAVATNGCKATASEIEDELLCEAVDDLNSWSYGPSSLMHSNDSSDPAFQTQSSE
jgi:hypothetical protein